jgi:hypothetical protein
MLALASGQITRDQFAEWVEAHVKPLATND